ncbi:BtpA/SgcQ family protein [Pseudonocardia sp. DLS-67]
MNWMRDVFAAEKPIVAMCHLKPLPGDPDYDADAGVEGVLEAARRDLRALQNGGVDGVMFSNEASLPYLTQVEPITTATMARVVGELRSQITVPFGVNVLWDATATVDLAVATGARFVREVFSGAYASDFGVWNTNAGRTVRHRRSVGGQDVRLLYNIVPEAAVYLNDRDVASVATSTVFNCRPDGLCVSGLTAGADTSADTLRAVKAAVPGTPVFANTGVRADTVAAQLEVADGAIVGTAFKRDGHIWNEVDEARVAALMAASRTLGEPAGAVP